MQNYLVYGLGRSGISVANFLIKNEENVFVYDDNNKLAQELKMGGLLNQNCEIIDKLCAKTLRIVHCIVLSPGVKLSKKLQKLVKEFNIEVIGEMAFASKFCTAPIYAVTGTNGKTTTVNILAHIFKVAKFNTHLVGNVGNPFSNEVDLIAPNDKVVCEVSSFQLEYSQGFSPLAVGFLNIAPDHLDRYASFEEYFSAKKIILDRVQENGKIFLNYDDEKVRKLGENRQNVEYFSLTELPQEYNGVFIRDNQIFRQKDSEAQFVANLDKIKLLGKHNLSNILCAVSLALFGGVLPSVIQKAINSAKPLKHRIQEVGEINGVKYYNDSKATNTNSTLVAVNSFENKNIWLLLGGSNKGESFVELIKQLPQNVVQIVAFGQMGKKIYKTALKQKFKNATLRKTLYTAFCYARENAKEGEIVLFSPACASFDEFDNYKQRGEYFCNLVLG